MFKNKIIKRLGEAESYLSAFITYKDFREYSEIYIMKELRIAVNFWFFWIKLIRRERKWSIHFIKRK